LTGLTFGTFSETSQPRDGETITLSTILEELRRFRASVESRLDAIESKLEIARPAVPANCDVAVQTDSPPFATATHVGFLDVALPTRSRESVDASFTVVHSRKTARGIKYSSLAHKNVRGFRVPVDENMRYNREAITVLNSGHRFSECRKSMHALLSATFRKKRQYELIAGDAAELGITGDLNFVWRGREYPIANVMAAPNIEEPADWACEYCIDGHSSDYHYELMECLDLAIGVLVTAIRARTLDDYDPAKHYTPWLDVRTEFVHKTVGVEHTDVSVPAVDYGPTPLGSFYTPLPAISEPESIRAPLNPLDLFSEGLGADEILERLRIDDEREEYDDMPTEEYLPRPSSIAPPPSYSDILTPCDTENLVLPSMESPGEKSTDPAPLSDFQSVFPLFGTRPPPSPEAISDHGDVDERSTVVAPPDPKTPDDLDCADDPVDLMNLPREEFRARFGCYPDELEDDDPDNPLFINYYDDPY
jgi:hypothetical protein